MTWSSQSDHFNVFCNGISVTEIRILLLLVTKMTSNSNRPTMNRNPPAPKSASAAAATHSTMDDGLPRAHGAPPPFVAEEPSRSPDLSSDVSSGPSPDSSPDPSPDRSPSNNTISIHGQIIVHNEKFYEELDKEIHRPDAKGFSKTVNHDSSNAIMEILTILEQGNKKAAKAVHKAASMRFGEFMPNWREELNKGTFKLDENLTSGLRCHGLEVLLYKDW